MTRTEAVLTEVKAERQRQNLKWGIQDDRHPMHWLAILGEEFGEACEAAVQSVDESDGDLTMSDYRREMVQVAAVAVAAIEGLDRADEAAKRAQN